MRQDPIWLAFAQTGDPLYYLLYRSVKEQEERRPGKKPAGSQTGGERAGGLHNYVSHNARAGAAGSTI